MQISRQAAGILLWMFALESQRHGGSKFSPPSRVSTERLRCVELFMKHGHNLVSG